MVEQLIEGIIFAGCPRALDVFPTISLLQTAWDDWNTATQSGNTKHLQFKLGHQSKDTIS